MWSWWHCAEQCRSVLCGGEQIPLPGEAQGRGRERKHQVYCPVHLSHICRAGRRFRSLPFRWSQDLGVASEHPYLGRLRGHSVGARNGAYTGLLQLSGPTVLSCPLAGADARLLWMGYRFLDSVLNEFWAKDRTPFCNGALFSMQRKSSVGAGLGDLVLL